MRIKSAHLRNFRIHKDTAVEFADGITLVEGPNESGKSTLAEAIRAGLFVKAKGTGSLLGSFGEEASVDLAIDAGQGRTATVSKAFGPRGTVSVTLSGEPTKRDSEADAALSGLLGGVKTLDRQRDAGEMDKVWGHLLVVQGRSGKLPLGGDSLTNDIEAQLTGALGKASGQSIVQSDKDGRVAELVDRRFESLFTQRGYKTGSLPEKADAARKAAETVQAKCRENVQARSELADQIDRLQKALSTIDREMEGTREKRAADAEQLERIQAIEDQMARFDQEAAPLVENAKRLRGTADALASARSSLEKTEKRATELIGKKTSLDALRDREKAAWDEAANRLREARKALDDIVREEFHVRLRLSEWESRQRRDRTDGELAKVARLASALDEAQSALDGTQPVGKKELAKAEAAETRIRAGESALEALGVRLTPQPGGEPVRANGEELPVGRETVLVEDFLLEIGSTAVRVILGGRDGLQERRETLKKALAERDGLLRKFGCPDIDALRGMAEGRAAAETARNAARKALEDALAGRTREAFEKDAADARREHAADKDNLRNAGLAPVPDEERPALAGQFSQLESRKQELDGQLEAVESNEKAALQTLRDVEAQQEKAQGDAQKAETEVSTLRGSLSALLRDWNGDEAAFRKALDQAVAAVAAKTGERVKLEEELASLEPDRTRRDIETLDENLSRLAKDCETRKTALIQNEARMTDDTGLDVNAALRNADAAVERASAEFDVQKRAADAIDLLHRTFEDAKRESEQNLSAPLAAKVKPYLEILFGKDAAVSLSGLVDGKPRLVLDRAGGNYDFPALSGGTAEQVGVALRLAMAEVLADGFDGHLPVMLDDAFVNSDEARVQNISRMLNLARDNGLQIIVLTCDASRYTRLAAERRITLSGGRVL